MRGTRDEVPVTFSQVAAKGACPPEDCGGPWGYANLKQILADPSHSEHWEMLEWLGLDSAGEFNPNDIAADNMHRTWS